MWSELFHSGRIRCKHMQDRIIFLNIIKQLSSIMYMQYYKKLQLLLILFWSRSLILLKLNGTTASKQRTVMWGQNEVLRSANAGLNCVCTAENLCIFRNSCTCVYVYVLRSDCLYIQLLCCLAEKSIYHPVFLKSIIKGTSAHTTALPYHPKRTDDRTPSLPCCHVHQYIQICVFSWLNVHNTYKVSKQRHEPHRKSSCKENVRW
jgi:hypothetical protein